MTSNEATRRKQATARPGLDPFPAPFNERPSMYHTWASLSFLHWPYDAEAVQRLLPPGLVADTCDGTAYVGLILFHLTVRPAWLPALPWLCSFAETNVRTYVRGPAGRPGIYFLSLDAARLGAVAVARASSWRLPYHWAAMRVGRDGDLVTYACRRRWSGSGDASSRVVLRVGAPYRPEELTTLDRFLTARWCFYTRSHRGVARTAAHHPPWRLTRGTALQVQDRLIAATGLQQPHGEPLVHWADRTHALIGRPTLDQPAATARHGHGRLLAG
jgi:uncharacterized protein YqjF (DUF2071 family)